MQLSQQQWFERLRTWVPSWFLIEEKHNVAILQAMAKLLADVGAEADSLVARTFIETAEAEWLDTLGQERVVTRQTDETDPALRPRIRNQSLISRCDLISIKAIVDSLLTVGECEIREDYTDGPFCSRGSYVDRGYILVDQILNAFSIVVRKQTHPPYSFEDRGYYADRLDFIGTEDVADGIYQAIINAVNDVKAYGVLYRLFESDSVNF